MQHECFRCIQLILHNYGNRVRAGVSRFSESFGFGEEEDVEAVDLVGGLRVP
jgi:hypothetical protein